MARSSPAVGYGTARVLAGPAAALALLVVFNALFTPGFFELSVIDGRIFGTPADILGHASRVAIVAMVMSLVIATGGVDLSVGAVMAIAGAVAATLTELGVPYPAAAAAALLSGAAAGLWNGSLVGLLRIQPIVATLVLMVSGRGIAQLVTGGVILTSSDPALAWPAAGSVAGVPAPIVIAAAAAAVLGLVARGTALGLFAEAVGDNAAAARVAGVADRAVVVAVYAVAGAGAALAGLIDCAYIRAADPANAGLYVELDAILAAVLGGAALGGGRFSLAGACVGAVFLQTLTTTMYQHDVPPEVATLPKALVVLAVCIAQSPAARDALRRSAGRRRAGAAEGGRP